MRSTATDMQKGVGYFNIFNSQTYSENDHHIHQLKYKDLCNYFLQTNEVLSVEPQSREPLNMTNFHFFQSEKNYIHIVIDIHYLLR